MVTAAQAAVYTVTKTADTDDGVCDAADCSLREAIATANLTADEDTIEFDPVLFASAQTINLSSDLLVLEGRLTINGPGAKLLTISGHSLIVGFPGGDMADLMLNRVTRSGGVFGIINAQILTVNDSIISNNSNPSFGGGINNQGSLTVNNSTISNNSAKEGGGINNKSGGTVTVNNSTISNNSATDGGGGIQTKDGTLTVNNSTISGNTVSESFGNGGGIDCRGSSTIVNNSTISGNSANQRGGGINNNGIALTLLNSTISKNSAPNGSGVFFSSIGVPTLRNTIIADNSSADLRTNGDIVNSLGYNLLGSFEEINGIADTDLVNQSARIAPLGYYGGQTMTHALLSDSLAINPASSNSAPVADQRGAARIGNADTGAFEVNNSANGGNFVAALPGGAQNVNYNFTLVPDNDSFTYTVTGGSLPNGVSLTTTPATDGVVALTGTPTEGGTFNFSVTVSDGTNSAVIDYALEILPSLDSTPPVITPTVTGTLGDNDWYVSDVQVSFSVIDGESVISDQTDCATQSVTADTAGITFTCSATSAGGTSTQSVTLKRDATAPTIAFDSRTAPNANGWNNSDVTINWSCADTLSGAANQSGSQIVSTDGANQSSTGTCADLAGNTAQNTQGGINIDKTAPVITFVSRTAPNAAGWNNTNVTVNWSCADELSGAVSSSVNQTVSAEGANQSAVGVCFDRAGNSASDTKGDISIDKTPPVIDPISNVTVYLPPNSTAISRTVNFPLPTASDNLTQNPTVSTNPVSGSVFNIGATTVSVTATDAAGNAAANSFTVTVLFNFAGFFQPVDNLPLLNISNAGQAIPVKFSLSGNKGLNIFAAGYPASGQIPCSANEPGNTIEETVNPGGSSLTYNATNDQYNYVWKTNKAWKGTCRILVVRFIDGSQYYAKFRFK